MSHLFFSHQPGATEVSGEISFTLLELLIKILKVQISTSPQESPHSCKESPLLSPPSRGSWSTAVLEKQPLPPSGAEPLQALALCPCPGKSKVGAGGTGDPPARACGCLWSEQSLGQSVWAAGGDIPLLPGFSQACGAFPDLILSVASSMALPESLASRWAQSCPGAGVGPGATSWHLGCGGDELQQGGSGGSSNFPSPGMMLRAGANPPQGKQSLMSPTLALCSHPRPGPHPQGDGPGLGMSPCCRG